MTAAAVSRRRALLGVCAVALLAACSPDTAPPAAAPTDAAATPPPTAAPPATEAEPTPVALPDGVVVAVDGGLAGGALYIVWDGTKERIQPPASFDDATLEELGLRVEPPISELAARAEPDPRTFWVVYPPDGPEARLHLAVADRLYPVDTLDAPRWQVDELPDAEDSLLNRMRPAE